MVKSNKEDKPEYFIKTTKMPFGDLKYPEYKYGVYDKATRRKAGQCRTRKDAVNYITNDLKGKVRK